MLADKWGYPRMNWNTEPYPPSHTPIPSLYSISDNDILPTCEFNCTVINKNRFFPWKKITTYEKCGEQAKWLVYIDIYECKNSEDNPHDHQVMTCTPHKYSFNHKEVQHFDCPTLNSPSSRYAITRIEVL